MADRKRSEYAIWRWLKAGILESGAWVETETGSPQGSGISPILANIFLHYVLDLWAHQVGEVAVHRFERDLTLPQIR